MDKKYIVMAIVFMCAVGYAFGRYFQPPQVVTKEVEVIKEVEVVKREVKTIIKEVTRPDGTKETTTTIDENTKETTRKDQNRQNETIVTAQKPQWKVDLMVKASLTNIIPVYGASVQRRILGPMFVGVQGWGDQSAGVSLGMEF